MAILFCNKEMCMGLFGQFKLQSNKIVYVVFFRFTTKLSNSLKLSYNLTSFTNKQKNGIEKGKRSAKNNYRLTFKQKLNYYNVTKSPFP